MLKERSASKRGKTVIYTRVSTSNQKDDLQNQVEYLRGKPRILPISMGR